MEGQQNDTIVVSLDLGSTHTSAMVAQVDADETSLQVLGHARVENGGMRRGVIINFDAVANGIQDAIDEAERQSGITVEKIRLSLGGASYLCDSITEKTSLKNDEVRPQDVERLHIAARALRPQSGYDALHVMPTGFTLDDTVGIIDPVGMCGSELGCQYHRIAFPQADLRNLLRACNHAGVHVEALVCKSLAAAEACLDPDEKELGVININLGAHITQVAVYSSRYPIYTRGYPIGSHHITKDLAIGLRTTQAEGERLKRDFGNSFSTITPFGNDAIAIGELTGRGQRSTTRNEICAIIEPRVLEIFETIKSDLAQQGLLGHAANGIVLTGGGALLNGLCVVAEQVFQLSTRLGSPERLAGHVEGLRTPANATLVGLFAPCFAPPAKEPSLFDKMIRKGGNRPIRHFAQELWAKVMEPFEV
jgi:cell division protein FtsA